MGLFSGSRPSDLGVKNGRLKAVPSSPNAVSSQATDAAHRIDPLTYQNRPERAMQALLEIIHKTPRTRIVTSNADYVYAEYESALMGFVDDVEFYFEPGAKVIQIRSASRVGYSDFGVNRKRLDDIRAKLATAGA
jgi:uncharacterized protein (DUF1499 family)